ncbi:MULTISPECIES: hypothetical protein [Psychrobacillus]|uniref:Uncharacterized protein n=1 Tax=Psychrobacillus lasiicapitis TaxID=1636719 RepID=A0A544SX67_9BACI|nr:hypothetical protein [Psychrobacillus lasiicapitis]TQR09803.1 hypothetical protein FG382_18865 [Psychrobacillus lasiicapitis]GGA23659.1 hypothetical protein GCM10011384_11600 [Psychrobacillus lasiicapitis]
MDKVEFKKAFDIGYEEMMFVANNDETFIRIKNSYSVPSSKVSSTIVHINGKLFEENRYWIFFTELVEIAADVSADVHIELDKFEVDIKDFEEEEFIQHLIDEITDKLEEHQVHTVLKEMEVL